MQKGLLKYSYFFLVLPVFVFLIIIKSTIESNFTPERVLYTYLILYLFSILISNRKIKFFYISFVYLVSIFLTYFELCYTLIYHERFTTSTIFILMETNSSEAIEYLKTYLNYKIILGLLILCFLSFFTLKGVEILIYSHTWKDILVGIKNDLLRLVNNRITKKTQQIFISINQNKARKIIASFVLIVIICTIYIGANHFKQHILYQAYEGFNKYKEERIKYNNFLFGNQKINDSFNAKSKNSEDLNETYVLVIGESTTKSHLQLYNYSRTTNPELIKIKNSLVVFEDVISPHTHTIPCLEKMLTLGNYENPEKKFDGTLIDIMKQAGFKTYWISNQIPVGIYETLITSIAKSADKVIFTNLGAERDQNSLDEKVLPYFNKVLSDKSVNKKFIVVHLLGTHVQYENRYPKKYNIFKDTQIPLLIYPSNDIIKTINHYDNAVLYNDYIVSEIIRELDNQTKEELSSLIYLSDHGEDVFETVDMAGHSESIASKPMYQVPFIFWSNSQNQIDTLQQFRTRKYMSDDLIYSFVDIANISFNDYDAERSVFNSNFNESRKRIIKDGNNYDELFR